MNESNVRKIFQFVAVFKSQIREQFIAVLPQNTSFSTWAILALGW